MEGRSQDGTCILHVLFDLPKPQKPQKPEAIWNFTPHCPMGVCTGASCPSYCPAAAVVRGRVTACEDATPPCTPCVPCMPCTPCTQCKEGKPCCEDCPNGCRGDCTNCPGCATCRGHQASQENPVCDSTRGGNEYLRHLCLVQEQTIRQFAVLTAQMHNETTQMRNEVAQLRQEIQALRNMMQPQVPYIMPPPPQLNWHGTSMPSGNVPMPHYYNFAPMPSVPMPMAPRVVPETLRTAPTPVCPSPTPPTSD
jgi:hypothetical protein